MIMVIYWANENEPNGGTSSQIHPNTSSTEDGAKGKTFFEEKIYRGHALFRSLAEKIIEKYFCSIFQFFSCLIFMFILNH